MPRWRDRPFREWLATYTEIKDMGYGTPCWIWISTRNAKGYGIRSRIPAAFGMPPQQYRIHRLAYHMLVGPIPAGLVIDHLCRNRACCNPAHLEPVTVAENNARSIPTAPGRPGLRSHCKRGHEFTPENVITTPTQRLCRACQRSPEQRARKAAYQREWKKKRQAAGLPYQYKRRA